MSKLVIVESPTKEKTISRFLEGNYIVKSSYGHIRDLPENGLGVNINKNFQPSYVLLPKAKRLLPALKKLSTNAEQVYLATDYDREGEAIAWHLIELLKPGKEKVKRITFHEITEEALNYALKHPRDIDLRLVNAQQARRILDRLVGYKISPLLWRKVQAGLSAGRVQSVALRLICDREEEIERFQPQEYWTITAEFRPTGEISEQRISAQLVEYAGKKLEKLSIPNQKEAEKIVKLLENAEYRVNKIIQKEKKRQPYPPFTTATLQQDAARKLNFGVNKTMYIAQQLYEGVELGEQGSVGLITYHRTDSFHVAPNAQREALNFIKETFGNKFLPTKPRVYRTKSKGAQEAHEAIRPTSVYRQPEKIRKYLTAEQDKLYTLVWQRFLASQMAEAIFDTLTLDISPVRDDKLPDSNGVSGNELACQSLFRATGQVIKFPGFLKVYSLEDETKENRLPVLKEGEILDLLSMLPEQHFTEPPARYNEASLIKTLEKYGIGRPSTYAPTISTLNERRYTEFKERKFYPTQLGNLVNELIKKHFPEIVDTNFTAKMEKNLDEIAQGKIPWTKVLNDFYTSFSQTLALAEKEMVRARPLVEKTEEKCSKCGAPMLLRSSRWGKFLSCSNYPRCKNKISLDRQGKKIIVQETNEKCEKCGRMMLLRTGRKGKFLTCSGFPKCRNIRFLPKT